MDSDRYEIVPIDKLKEVYGSYFTYKVDGISLFEEKRIVEVLGKNISQKFYTVDHLQNSFKKNKKVEIEINLQGLEIYAEDNKNRFALAKLGLATKEMKNQYFDYLEEKDLCQNSLKELGTENLSVEYLKGDRKVHKHRLIPEQSVYITNEDLNNLYIKDAVVSEIYTTGKEWVHTGEEKEVDIFFKYVVKEHQGRDYIIELENASNAGLYFNTDNFTRKVFINYEDALDHLEKCLERGLEKINKTKEDLKKYRK